MTSGSGVDLTNCDREPIHIPGSIQPHGCLLACDSVAGLVLRHSANAPEMLGVAGDLNGRRLDDVIGAEAAHEIRNALARSGGSSRPALTFDLTVPSGTSFDVSAHVFKGTAIIEFEPAGASVAEPLELARTLITHIRAIGERSALFNTMARMTRAMLGYDRVMIYQLGADGAGKVIAESKRADLESFLGQFFPASDIPQQARALYVKTPIRIISDAQFKSVPVDPVLDISGEPLDLSYAHLRSVSPIHCEYLRNMGVGASMSISIIVDGTLWGLIACHHYAPRALTMGQRVSAEMLGEFISLHIETLRAQDALEASAKARLFLDDILLHASRAGDLAELMRQRLDEIQRLIPCDGIGISIEGRWFESGVTPPKSAIPALLRFAEGAAEGRIWATNHLAAAHPASEDYAAAAAGMLAIPLSQRPKDYVLLFRKEQVETLEWAGDPNKTYEQGALGERLTPRKSFAVWKETVHHRSIPWTDQDRQFGEALRSAVVEIALRQSELLTDERSKADVRQRMLNEELNHRVKNILALIGALVAHPTAEGQTLNGYVASLKGRIQALSLAHDQVVRGDGGGALSGLLDAELTPYRTSPDAIRLSGPNVVLDARAYSVMALVLHELATNAAKYGALSRSTGTLSVTWLVDEGGACDIAWREIGGPTVTAPSRRGFGSVLIDRSIPFDLGGSSLVEYPPEGVRADLKIPSKHLSMGEDAVAEGALAAKDPVANDSSVLTDRSIMILEDQLVIAIGLEQILAGAGVKTVFTTSSEPEALRVLRDRSPDLAVLDINLGSGTSIVVAEALAEARIPFLFATGYGDTVNIPNHLRHIPVVRKPYDATSILEQLKAICAEPFSAWKKR